MRLPDDLVTRWRLSDPQPVADTPTGTVWKVMQANGHPAALKLLRPGEVEEARGADYWWRSAGTRPSRSWPATVTRS